jgi:predicted O-methyltransferase YrrM
VERLNNNAAAAGALFTQIYKKYRDKILIDVFHRNLIKPWMEYKEIEIVEEILCNLQPERSLEWGAGYSTLYFPKCLKRNARWISVEHYRDWATKIEHMNQNPDVKIILVEPNHFPWTDPDKDGASSDLEDYLEFPTQFGNFDFILIDGRARNAALIKAYELIKNDGVVVLHDANRRRYHTAFEKYKHQALFVDHRKNRGGLWVGSKGVDLHTVLNVDKHRRLWQILHRMRKVLGRYSPP